ncbi:hypothetical protein E1B28_005095 [Marasmius oreades]|uniref:DDE Tnp4 domain-containing protein n=1 Tax=Marasmius oreades TaxID=181124 RepID=A0A9P7UZX2_9AGAR|nr:uncharacterized protein E1B28_005095 [Marasmius oreades]KAG7097776.1 hypothetical protein E1B28_005095 [Marasmius oreades]
MPQSTLHEQYKRAYLLHAMTRNFAYLATSGIMDSDSDSSELDSDSDLSQVSDGNKYDEVLYEMQHYLQFDLAVLQKIQDTRYLRPHEPIVKCGQLHLLADYALDPNHQEYARFLNLVHVPPRVFGALLDLIEDHPVFRNNSNNPQTPVDVQLAVTLYRMGRYGNGAQVVDIARFAGVSEGSVELFTTHCFEAIESLLPVFVRPLTKDEKEVEKKWIDERVGFEGLWREGYLMYDGTIVPLYAKPGLDGATYYTRKCNYGLNAQIGNAPSTLRIVDFSHGLTGSAHDVSAFEYTCAYKYPGFLFEGDEFGWGDSAYPVTEHIFLFISVLQLTIPKTEFLTKCSQTSESVLNIALVDINNKEQHVKACWWITIAIILHNAVINIEGARSGEYFGSVSGGTGTGEEEIEPETADDGDEIGEAKRKRLVFEANEAKRLRSDNM